MKALDLETLPEMFASHGVSKRLIRELKYVPIDDIEDRDFAVVYNRQKSAGVLIFDGLPLQFSLEKRKASSKGRVEPIICDLCKTWRRGSESALITFRRRGASSVTYLCCGDLDCSLHARGQTKVAVLSKTQLREQVDTEARIKRLQDKLREISRHLIA